MYGVQYCTNCGAVVTGKFCAQCGMRIGKKEINFKSLITPVIEKLTHWEKKVVVTVKCLFKEPGTVPRVFIEGERRKYYHPVKFVLYCAGVNILISIALGNGLGNLVVNAGHYDPVFDKVAQITQNQIAKHYALMWIFCIPFLSLAPFLVFGSSKLKFVYHNVILCYLVGVNLIIGIPSMIIIALWKSSEPVIDNIWSILPFLYCFYMYHNYFKQRIWKSILCSVLSFVFLLVGYTVLYSIIFTILSIYEFSKAGTF